MGGRSTADYGLGRGGGGEEARSEPLRPIDRLMLGKGRREEERKRGRRVREGRSKTREAVKRRVHAIVGPARRAFL